MRGVCLKNLKDGFGRGNEVLALGLVVLLVGVVGWPGERAGYAEETVSVRVGLHAPDFTLRDQDGRSLSLSQFRGDKRVVLYFYPKNDTPGCTAEACSFRDDMSRFDALNVQVLGISVDGLGSHRTFSKKYRLNFPILSDEAHRVSRVYGVLTTVAGYSYAKRTTFVIDVDGTILKIFSDVDPDEHALEVLRYLGNRTPSVPVDGWQVAEKVHLLRSQSSKILTYDPVRSGFLLSCGLASGAF